MISVTNDILSITLYRTLTINIPFPLYRPLLGIYYPLSIVYTPSVCNNCLTKITPQDEQGVLNSKDSSISIRFTVRRIILIAPKQSYYIQNVEAPVNNQPNLKVLAIRIMQPACLEKNLLKLSQ